MFGHQGSGTAGSSGKQLALYAGVLTFTVILSSGIALFGFRWVTEPRQPSQTLDAVSLAASAQGAPPAAKSESVNSTRFVVGEPKDLLDSRRTGVLAAGEEIPLELSGISPDSSAVLLEVSMLKASAPGQVIVSSDADEVPALRVPAKGAMTSATVVVLIGADHSLRLRTEGGGQVLVNLAGAFEPADSATSGRIIPLTPAQVLRMRPAVDGHDVDLKVDQMAALRRAGPISALLLHVAADVGVNGGHVYLGPSKGDLSQRVLWSATSGDDRTRHGFMVVPVRKGTFHLQYHAGTELRADVVGFVTGEGASESDTGLVVPLPYQAGGAVRVAADGRTDVPVVPAAGLVGVKPDQVTAAFLGLTADSDSQGDVTVTAPGRQAGRPVLSVAPGLPRSAFALSRVTDGALSVAGESGANVIVTPRALIL